MKIVIDIPDERYKNIQRIAEVQLGLARFQTAEQIIAKGTPQPKTDTLDKIRAEIEMYEADCRLQGGKDECEKCNSNVFGSIYRIIDKYTAESEVQDADSD